MTSIQSPETQHLLELMRGHKGMQGLLKAIPASLPPRYKRSRSGNSQTLEQFGAEAVFESGRQAMREQVIALLTGSPIEKEE